MCVMLQPSGWCYTSVLAGKKRNIARAYVQPRGRGLLLLSFKAKYNPDYLSLIGIWLHIAGPQRDQWECLKERWVLTPS